MRPHRASPAVPAALVALLLIGAVPLAPAAPAAHATLDLAEPRLAFAVTDDHLDVRGEAAPVREARSLLADVAGTLRLPVVGLDVLLVFTQPALRGEADIVAVVGVVPRGGDEWRGLHWVESSEGATQPTPTTIPADGRLFLLHAPADPEGAELRASYHFLGPNGTEFALELPRIEVLDEAPVTGGVLIGGAATSVPHARLPDLVVVSVWNAAPTALPMGVSLMGNQARLDHPAGGCTPETYEQHASEAGCRAIFVLERTGRLLVAWHDAPDGERVHDQTLRLRTLDRAPYAWTV